LTGLQRLVEGGRMYFVISSSITTTVTSSIKNVPFGSRKIDAIISMPSI